MNTLFVSQEIGSDENSSEHCGIGIRGKLTASILVKSTKYNIIPCYMNDQSTLEDLIILHQPKIIFYNYHSHTTSWLDDQTIRNKYNDIKHVMIHYDITQDIINNYNPDNFVGFKYAITDNDTLSGTEQVFRVNRSIPYCDFIETDKNNEDGIPIIGFQGFGFWHKGIEHIALNIQKEFDEAIFRLQLPYAHFCPTAKQDTEEILKTVRGIITKPGIKLEVSHDFMTTEEVVKWLHSNTINCYFNHYPYPAGIASSPDYAIAAKKPIAITTNHMLQHLQGLTPSIQIEHNTLKTIISNGTTPLEPIYARYSHSQLIHDYETICNKLLTI